MEFVESILGALFLDRQQRRAHQAYGIVRAELAQPVIESSKARQAQIAVLDIVHAGRNAKVYDRGITTVRPHILNVLAGIPRATNNLVEFKPTRE
jgi:hypothetical protein